MGSIKHAKTSPVPNPLGDTRRVGGGDWNSEHVIDLDVSDINGLEARLIPVDQVEQFRDDALAFRNEAAGSASDAAASAAEAAATVGALAAPGGAELVGAGTEGTVQDALDGRVKASTLAGTGGASEVGMADGRTVEERIAAIPAEVDAAGTAEAKVVEHNSDVAAHPELSAFITAEADRAENAADASFSSSGLFVDLPAFDAAVVNGKMGGIKSADPNVAYDIAQKVGGVSSNTGKSVPSSAAVKGAIIGVVGKNKFNKAAVTAGVALSNVGATFAAAGRNVSEYIPVLPSTAYRCSLGVNKLCWYSSASPAGFLSFVDGPGAVASPGAAAFARIDVSDASLGTVQMELGSSATPYESFRYLSPSSTVARSAIRARAVGVNEIDANVIEPWQLNDVYFLNMHDGSLVVGLRLNDDGMTEAVDATTNHTNWIPAKENTQYSVSAMSRAFFYRADQSLISMSASGASPFVTPAGCTGMKFNLFAPSSASFQLNEGATATTPKQPYKYTPRKLYVPPMTRAQIALTSGRIYNLADAWVAWQNGEKFPVAFLGDSTTNGNGTTGYVARVFPYTFGDDYVAPNAYPKQLEDIVRAATGSAVARCYNLGYTGQRATWALANIDALMSGNAADSKMVGLRWAINDRTANLKLYQTNLTRDVEGLIIALYGKGMQPFLITSQPTTIPNWPDASSSSGPSIETVGNTVLRNLAEKWGLEIIEANAFCRDFQTYSALPLLSPLATPHSGIYEANGGTIHWNDVGHKYQAGLFFASICNRVIWSDKGEILDYASQFVKSVVNWDQVTQLEVPTDGWKIQAKYNKATAADEVLQDFWYFNTYRGRLNLTAHAVDAPESAYVKLNGVTTPMDAVTKAIGTMEMGLHHIEAWSGATTAVNWRGFKALI